MRGLRSVRLVLALCLVTASPLAAQGTFAETRRPAVAVQKAAFSCPAPQLVFQKPDGKMTCIAPDANPCPQGQVLDKTTTPGRAACKALLAKKAFSCPAPQLVFQKADGNFTCIAADANPCPPGQVLDTATKPGSAGCKALPAKAPFACPAPQIVFKRPDGNMTCISPDANPCPQGQVLDTTTKPGVAGCKPLPARTPIACPAGQVPFQKANGQFVCVAGP